MSLKADIEAVAQNVLKGAPTKLLVPQVGSIVKAKGADPEDIVGLFKLLPRALSFPHIDDFFAAEAKVGSTDISSSLVESGFADCIADDADAATKAKLLSVIATACGRIGADSPLAHDVFRWRLRLCAEAPKQADLDAHARAAIVYALNSNTIFLFEPIADAVAKVAAASKETKALVEFVSTVMLEGSGMKGLNAFLGKAGKTFFADVGVHGIERKVRIVALCPLLSGKTTVTLGEVKTALELATEEDAEGIVIDAAVAKVVDCRVNHSTSTVEVRAVASLQFKEAAWKELLGRIESTEKFVSALLAEYKSA